jgi:putative transposase
MKALKVRIYPNKEQADFLNQQFGSIRLVYNKALYVISTKYKRYGISLNAKKDIKKLLPIAKKSRKYGWLSAYDSLSLQQSCINLDKAFTSFFKKQSKYPRYKSKHGKQSSYHCGNVSCGDNWVSIPKLKTKIKAKIHRNIANDISSITITKTSTGKYYASMCLKQDDIETTKITQFNENNVVGLDMGLTHLIIKSDGDKVDNPRLLKQATKNLKIKQKKLSRKLKGSKSRNKARLLIAKAHERLSNCRADFQHKQSKAIIDENQAVIVETLKVKNMLKNKKLSKHISDASWYSFIQKLSYKAQEQGKHLIKIDQWYPSSKTCSECGYIVEKMPLQTRNWNCPECQASLDRDINASINIKNKGIEFLKAEGMSVSAVGGLCKSA